MVTQEVVQLFVQAQKPDTWQRLAGLESRAAELQNPALSLCTVLLSGPSFKKSLELQSLKIV